MTCNKLYKLISTLFYMCIHIASFLTTMRFRALWCFIVGVLTLIGMCGYAGLLIYAWYHECDPLTTKVTFI